MGFAPGQTDAGGDSWAHEPVLVVRDYEGQPRGDRNASERRGHAFPSR